MLKIKLHKCPICAGYRPILNVINKKEFVRCSFCFSGIATLAIATVINEEINKHDKKIVYETSSKGRLLKYLNDNFKEVICSDYLPEKKNGIYLSGFYNQNLEELTFHQRTFDLVTSTEVMEHVFNDEKAFREVYRVLKPKGKYIFTIPLNTVSNKTVVRAKLENGEVNYLKKKKYHSDKLTGRNTVLVVRDYGMDILNLITDIGFAKVKHRRIGIQNEYFGFSNSVIIAEK